MVGLAAASSQSAHVEVSQGRSEIGDVGAVQRDGSDVGVDRHVQGSSSEVEAGDGRGEEAAGGARSETRDVDGGDAEPRERVVQGAAGETSGGPVREAGRKRELSGAARAGGVSPEAARTAPGANRPSKTTKKKDKYADKKRQTT